MKFDNKKRIKNSKEHRINKEIKARFVFLVIKDQDNREVPFFDALNLANDQGLDLVQIASKDDIPVCKIMNYGKFCYEQKKKKKPQKKETKIVQINPAMADNDFNIKLKQILVFLKDKHKVSVLLQLKGRQVDYPEISLNMLNKCVEFCKEVGKVDLAPKLEGKKGMLILSPILV